MASEIRDGYWANQFDNRANRLAHVETTGPEIWEQTEGRLGAFVAASGTGGTLAGVSEYLKSKNPAVRTVLADPPGSALYEFIRNGSLKPTGSGSITEGIGIGRVTANMQDAPIDDAVHVEDADSVACVYQLLREEGLFLGSTSGVNVVAATRVARQLGPGHTGRDCVCAIRARSTSADCTTASGWRKRVCCKPRWARRLERRAAPLMNRAHPLLSNGLRLRPGCTGKLHFKRT